MKFFYDLSTKTKLLVCFTIVIAINLIISITTLTSLNQVNKAAEEIDGVLNAAFSRTFTVQEALEKTQFSFSTGLNMLYFDYDEKMLERDAPQLIADIKTRVNALNPDFLGTQEYRDLCLEVKQAALNSVKILEERVMPKIQRDAFSDANSTFTTEVYPELARAISACSALYKIQTQHCLSLTQAASDSTIVFVDSILTVVGVIMALICGSASGAIAMTLEMFSNAWIAAGLDPEWIHRVVVTASGGFDTVPWNSFVVLILSMGKLNHKQAYMPVFWVSLVAPILVALLGVFFV